MLYQESVHEIHGGFCIFMLLSVIKPFPDDIKELYDMKLSPGHIVGFSNECSSASKRLTLMKVGKHIDFVSVVSKYCKLIFHIFSLF